MTPVIPLNPEELWQECDPNQFNFETTAELGDLDAVKLYEATPYIETRKDDNDKEYESERHLDLVTHYFSEDPLADDPAFVSLVKK